MGWLDLIPILEIDEIKQEVVGDKTHVEIITTGINPKLAGFKTKIMGVISFPPKIYKVTDVEEQRRNPIFKRYKVKAECPRKFSIFKGGLGERVRERLKK